MKKPGPKSHIHFLGIGGIGVSALAQLAQARGFSVSGSDINIDVRGNPALARLISRGAEVIAGHAPDNIPENTSLVVTSAAISHENPELISAIERSIRVVTRADYLGELMAAHRGPKIAVAGTHGKTTTTGMIGVMLQEAGLDPTVFVGAEISQFGGNIRIGSETGPFIAEACEAYDSFLALAPDIAVITNIEADHLDHYHSFEGVLDAFKKFVRRVPESGAVVACMDDAGVRRLERECDIAAELCHYGIEFGIDSIHGVKFADAVTGGVNPSFDVQYGGKKVTVRLKTAGRHNVQNALAALLVGSILNVPGQGAAAGLSAFTGASRRQEVLGVVRMGGGSILVIDDYAHHPTEISATIEAVTGAYPARRLVVVFQPHLYSRTRDFIEGFAESLSKADVLAVTGIYAARESPIPGVRASEIVSKASKLNSGSIAIFVPNKTDVPATVAALSQPGDVVLFLGAGDIREQAELYVNLVSRDSSRGAR
jgi:UDP-N-acetylmuramate--alanine ligase